MYNIKLLITYQGTHYLGWQKTKMGPSIEEALEKALAQLLHIQPSLQAASRTDAGVHAEEQVVNFFAKDEIDTYKLKRGLNALLPKDISVYDVEVAHLEFHPTLDSTAKEYHYYICNSSVQLPFYSQLSWHYPIPLSIEMIREASISLIGKHDFSAFCNDRALLQKDPFREIYSLKVESLPQRRLKIAIIGNRFLYKMVRNIVGTLVYIGSGKLPLDSLPQILESKDRTKAGITAPAHGLYLNKVFYK